jgi:carbon starvation protein
LLAGLALLAVATWLGNIGKSNKMFFIPMAFMLIVTITGLCITFHQRLMSILSGTFDSGHVIQIIFAVVLVVLAITLIVEGIQTFSKQAKGQKTGAAQS